ASDPAARMAVVTDGNASGAYGASRHEGILAATRLLQLDRHHFAIELAAGMIVDRHPLIAPGTGKFIGSHQKHLLGVWHYQFKSFARGCAGRRLRSAASF